jgi:hypothetical protein
MLTEILIRIPFTVIGRFRLVLTFHWLHRKNAQALTHHRRLPIWFYRTTGGFLSALSVSKSPL